MQRDHLYVRDIVRACDAIARYVAGVDRDAFLAIILASEYGDTDLTT